MLLLPHLPPNCVGPYHRNLRQGWQQQVADATNVWHLNMTQDDPDVVVVSRAAFFGFRPHQQTSAHFQPRPGSEPQEQAPLQQYPITHKLLRTLKPSNLSVWALVCAG